MKNQRQDNFDINDNYSDDFFEDSNNLNSKNSNF